MKRFLMLQFLIVPDISILYCYGAIVIKDEPTRGDYWRRRWHPLQCSSLENPRDRGAWWAAARGTRLSDFTFPFPFHALEKEMATHSSVLAWRIPGMGEPGGLPSMGSHRVGHD